MYKILFLFVFSAESVLSANILYISNVPSPSHHIWNRVLAFALAERGHNVTLLGPQKDRSHPANYTHILIEDLQEVFSTSIDQEAMAEFTPLQTIYRIVQLCMIACKSTLNSQGLQTLLQYPPDFFDLIIIDIIPGTCMYPLIQRFNYPPAVATSAFLLPQYVAYNFGNHLYPSYIPWYGLPYTQDMSFFERLKNSILSYAEVYIRNTQQYETEHEEAKKVFGENIPSMDTLERHISLVLTNTDPILDRPQPLAPNFIPVGGLHTREPKELPQDLQTILDGAKDGVIVFSLGTNVRSDKLSKEIQKALLDAFSKIKETVIWKFESDIKNLPKNVIVRKWLPQNDLLGHPNVKLFIGHGGALSTQEAIFHGVPIICVPFFLDQIVNSRSIVGRKLGISLDYKLITSDYISEKLKEILHNPAYSENMKRVSAAFRDRAETPLERGIFWVEYALRHGGAGFLNTPAKDLPFYKSSGLDILFFLISATVASFAVVYKFFQIISKVCRKNVQDKVKVN